MELSCPTCGYRAQGADMHKLNEGVVYCPECCEDWSIAGNNIDDEDKSYKDVAKPIGISVKKGFDGLEISTNFFAFGSGKLFAILTVFFGFGVFTVLHNKGYQHGNYGELIAVGIWGVILLCWFTGLLGRQTARLKMQHIEVGKKRLGYFFKKHDLRLNEVDQFYVKQRKITSDGNTSFTYDVVANVTGGLGNITIFKGFQEATIAYYVEQRIEAYLGITDEKVAGEFDERRFIEPSFTNMIKMMRQLGRNHKADKEEQKKNLF